RECDEYERLMTTEADREANRIGRLVAHAEELSDEDVDLLLASAPEVPHASRAQLKREVEQALGRLQWAQYVQPPLEQLRRSQGLTVGDLVDAFIERLHLDRGKRRKIRRYYEELEAGLIDAAKVSGRIWEVLAERLQKRIDDLAALPRPIPGAIQAGA